jgi:ribose 5-phosphate isomerase A
MICLKAFACYWTLEPWAQQAEDNKMSRTADDLKREAAREAAKLVRDGMRLGLGTGSTAKHFVDAVGELVKSGLLLLCVPTSETTRLQAEALGIPLSTLDETPRLDLTVDGADELTPDLALIKGGGAAHLREKIVANASKRMIVVADSSKLVDRLGAFALPLEVSSFGLGATRLALAAAIKQAGCSGDLVMRCRADGSATVTDGGNLILDAKLGAIADPERLAASLDAVPGLVEHGLFLGLATGAVIAYQDRIGIIGSLERERALT